MLAEIAQPLPFLSPGPGRPASSELFDSLERLSTSKLLLLVAGWGLSEPDGQRFELLLSLARSSRREVRRRVAEILGAVTSRLPDELERPLLQLAQDPDREVRQVSARSLGLILSRGGQATTKARFSRWASSRESLVRQAAARALAGPATLYVAAEGLQLLSLDWITEVRLAVVEAARERLPASPATCLRLLQDLSKDSARSVRLAALDGLQHACGLGLGADCIPWLEDGVLSTDLVTARKSASILHLAGRRSPISALVSYGHIAARSDLADPEILTGMVGAILAIAAADRPRARRILERLGNHGQDAVSGPARAGLERLGD